MEVRLRSTVESNDTLITTKIIEGINESDVKYQANSTLVQQLII